MPRRSDPALEKKRARIAAKYAAANIFEAVAEEWLVKCERDGLAPVTVDKIRWLLAKAYPLIGSIPIAQITPHEALAVLREVEATGAYESARRMRSVLSRVFRYGVATVRCDKDVAADLRGAIAVPKVRHFATITRPSEVGALLRAIDGYSGHEVTVMAMLKDLHEHTRVSVSLARRCRRTPSSKACANSAIRTVDVVARSGGSDRLDPVRIGDYMLTGANGQRVPVSQIGKPEVRMETPILQRRDRLTTITVHGDIADGLQPSDVSKAMLEKLQPLISTLPSGYRIDTVGSIEEAGKANAALAPIFPIMAVLIRRPVCLLLITLEEVAIADPVSDQVLTTGRTGSLRDGDSRQ